MSRVGRRTEIELLVEQGAKAFHDGHHRNTGRRLGSQFYHWARGYDQAEAEAVAKEARAIGGDYDNLMCAIAEMEMEGEISTKLGSVLIGILERTNEQR